MWNKSDRSPTAFWRDSRRLGRLGEFLNYHLMTMLWESNHSAEGGESYPCCLPSMQRLEAMPSLESLDHLQE